MNIFLLCNNRKWTLKSDKEHTIGNSEDCDVPILDTESETNYQFKLGFDSEVNAWYVDSLGNRKILIGSLPFERTAIRYQTTIIAPNSTVFTVMPEIAQKKGAYTPPQVSSTAAVPIGSQVSPIFPTTNRGTYSQQPIFNQQPASAQSLQRPATSSISKQYDSASKTVDLGFKWFRISSPEDGVGIELKTYKLVQTYVADRTKVKRVCEKLHERVLESVREGKMGDAIERAFTYKKGLDDRRTFIRVLRDNMHGVRTTIFIRFLDYGDNLYIGLNVYVLGNLSLWKLFIKLAISGVVLLPLLTGALGLSVFLIPLLIVMWWKLFWRTAYEDGQFGLALRQEFPGDLGSDLFNIDDISMFSKSTLYLATDAIHKVFEEEGLPLESLDNYINQINNITNVNTEGGNIVNAAIGVANKIIGNQPTEIQS